MGTTTQAPHHGRAREDVDTAGYGRRCPLMRADDVDRPASDATYERENADDDAEHVDQDFRHAGCHQHHDDIHDDTCATMTTLQAYSTGDNAGVMLLSSCFMLMTFWWLMSLRH